MQPDIKETAIAHVKTDAAESQPGGNLDRVLQIPVTLKVLLGSASMPIFQLTKLARGAVIPLDRRVGEPVDVMINGQNHRSWRNRGVG